MATNLATKSTSLEAAAVFSRSVSKQMLLVATVLLLAHAPLLYWHFCSILAKPHYQFVIVLPIGVAAVAWQRLTEVQNLQPGAQSANLILGFGSLAVLIGATLFWSPWLGAVAAVLTVLFWVHVVGGWALVKCLLPAWLLLWFAVALPIGLDTTLIQSLRGYTTTWTSAVLDEMGVRHLVEGNTIRVPQKAFFVADACTGIHSLFVVGAIAVFLGFWHRRTIFQIIALLVCALALVLVENVSRLVGVVAIYQWGRDISEGWPHQVFGGLVFVATLLLLISADQFISFAVPKRIAFWRREKKRQTQRRQADAPETTRFSQNYRLLWKPLVPLLVGFAIVGFWQVARAPAGAPQISESLGNPFRPLAQLKAEDMPARIGSWVRKKHEFVERAVDDPQGAFSQIWIYQRDGRSVELAVDFPFAAMHDSCLCFENLGWTLDKQRIIPNEMSDAGMVEAQFTKELGGNGYLLASHLDLRGEFGARLYPRGEREVDARLLDRLKSFLGRQTSTSNQPPGTNLIAGPVAQLRMWASSYRTFTNEESTQLSDFYGAARLLLRTACQHKLQEKE